MGEEKKEEEEENKGGGEENKGESAEKGVEEEIVLKVDMHCEACARKVARSLRGFQGVEDVKADCKASKVVVKGKMADPIKVCERIEKKSRKKVEILSPLPQPPPPPPEEIKPDDEPPKQQDDQKKDEPPAVITVVLQVGMHCDACAHALQKRIRRIQGVEEVTADVANDQVTVKGIVDPTTLVKDVYKKTRKHASLVVNNDEEGKNNQQQEEDQKKEGEEEKGEEAEQLHLDDHQKMMVMMMTTMDDIKKREHHLPYSSMVEYHYAYNPPHQMFSDENPHACSLM